MTAHTLDDLGITFKSMLHRNEPQKERRLQNVEILENIYRQCSAEKSPCSFSIASAWNGAVQSMLVRAHTAQESFGNGRPAARVFRVGVRGMVVVCVVILCNKK